MIRRDVDLQNIAIAIIYIYIYIYIYIQPTYKLQINSSLKVT